MNRGIAMKNIVNGVPIDAVIRVELGMDTYFFSVQNFDGVYADIDRAKRDPDYMEYCLMQIIKKDLGLSWSFLQ